MDDENGHHYVGLQNQGSTCYMNSLLQALYMTPEFRNAVLRYEHKANDDEVVARNTRSRATTATSPPPMIVQLQHLFLRMMCSQRASVETKQFTSSLGTCWAFKPWEQRDSHELLRCMFDTLLEQQGNAENAPINQIYRGTVEDCIRCAYCSKEEVRIEPFLDLSLAVKQRNGKTAFDSVEESLVSYFLPQSLPDEPCEQCHRVGGLSKGFRPKQFPHVLTLHLKRFDMDNDKMQRYKLNDRISFSEFIDLENILAQIRFEQQSIQQLNEMPMEISDDEDANIEASHCSNLIFYELFAVIVHQGRSNSGHYYTYAKNLDLSHQQQWICFNDSSVSKASWQSVESAFGATVTKRSNYYGYYGSGWYDRQTEYGQSYGNSTNNAYLLMYRRVDSRQNEHFIPSSKLPAQLYEAACKIKMETSRNWTFNSKKQPQKITSNAKNYNELGNWQPVTKSTSTYNTTSSSSQHLRSAEQKKYRWLSDQIQECQALLDTCLDLSKKLEQTGQSTDIGCCPLWKTSSPIYEWKREFREVQARLQLELNGAGLFDSSRLPSVIASAEGRRLFTDWLSLQRAVQNEYLISAKLALLINCLPSVAQLLDAHNDGQRNAPHPSSSEIMEICRIFEQFNISNISLNFKLKWELDWPIEMVENSELLQRTLLSLTGCVARNDDSFVDRLLLYSKKTNPCLHLLTMPYGRLRFNPLVEHGVMRNQDGKYVMTVSAQSRHNMRLLGQQLFEYWVKTQQSFNNESVAYWIGYLFS